jgi:hypothetical protein
MGFQNYGWTPTKRVVKGGRKVVRVQSKTITEHNFKTLPMRELLKGGDHLGKIPGKFFMQQAMSDRKADAVKIIAQSLRQEIKLYAMADHIIAGK